MKTAPSLYHPNSRKCVCKGRGLIPPERPASGIQAFCPIHQIQRYWPQLQKNGSVELKPLGKDGLINERKRMRRMP